MGTQEEAVYSSRTQKEQFVSNLEGTTMQEIAFIMSFTPVAVVLRLLLAAFLDPGGGKDKKAARGHPRVFGLAFLDYVTIFVPSLLSMTKPELSSSLMLAMVGGALLLTVAGHMYYDLQMLTFSRPSSSTRRQLASPRKAFISYYRSALMLMVIIAILAVDFPVFPRRFAKAESFGTGLMDTGTGSFVISNALVSREARGSSSRKPGGVLRSTSPLLLLGMARLLLTKGVDYQVHVGEYGVHWNFFFTLAAVALLTSAVCIPPSWSGLAGVALLAGYQVALSCFGWSAYLVSPERGQSLLSLNKEGVGSSIGYWALYLLSVQLGRYLLAASTSLGLATVETSKSEPKGDSYTGLTLVAQVGALDAALWAVTFFLDRYIERISRRTCNAAYVAWMLALNLQAIGTFLVIQLWLPYCRIPFLEAFDKNLFSTFLVANVLTGLVNLSVDTMSMQAMGSHLILLGYLAAVLAFVTIAHSRDWVLKFW